MALCFEFIGIVYSPAALQPLDPSSVGAACAYSFQTFNAHPGVLVQATVQKQRLQLFSHDSNSVFLDSWHVRERRQLQVAPIIAYTVVMNELEQDPRFERAIATELNVPLRSVRSAVELLKSGNTIPFIARYRKEATGSLDEIALRRIEDALQRWQALVARKSTVLKSIQEQGAMTDALRNQIEACQEMVALEAIYFPYKPKRRTRATMARERGLEPLAKIIVAQKSLSQPKTALLDSYVDLAQDVPDSKAALQGALDIIAEWWSEDATTRALLVNKGLKFGEVASTLKRGKKNEPGAEKFEQYFDRREPVTRIPSHRFLAMMRGSAESILKISLELDEQRELRELRGNWIVNRQFEFHRELLDCSADCLSRLLLPATESTVLQQLKERADDEAIDVFGKNLQELLMAAPAGPRVTLGIDPGFRTGCKVAVVDQTGKFLENVTIYPTPPKNDTETAAKVLTGLIEKFGVELIAIGNGTASRETGAFVETMVRDRELDVTVVTVSESGASVYSASDIAVKEFPNLDITIRGAISIARRLQDPLAELVKTDPKSIGVGQYQHDVQQTKLRVCLDRVVQSCVNRVGVNVNMASAPLLSYVAGVGPKLAENIVAYRDQHGQFVDRKQLRSVEKLGAKAFEQAAGFLRVDNGKQPLDNSAVHPESYPMVKRMVAALKTDISSLMGNVGLSQKLNPQDFVDSEFGLPTIEDIISELAKPGRDPRREFRVVKFNDHVNQIQDLKPNLVLEGVITNVTHFGAFVDIGVHQDALIHISQLADGFVADPNQCVAVGDVVKVKVLEVDVPRKRIAVTRRLR